MAWYLTPQNRLCRVTPQGTEGFVQLIFYDPNGFTCVAGVFDLKGYVEVPQEVADILKGEVHANDI